MRHHKNIRLIAAQHGNRLRILDLHRLKDGNIMGDCTGLYRRHLQFLPSSLRLIRLCHHSGYLMSCLYERLQCAYRKIRRSHKYNFHISRYSSSSSSSVRSSVFKSGPSTFST